MDATWLLSWWNLVFIAPLALAMLYIGVYAFTGVTFGEADADAGVGAGVEADAGGGVGHGDGDGFDHGHDHGHAAVEPDHEASFVQSLLSFLGFGKAPLSIVLTVLLIGWGVLGLLTNFALQHVVPADWMVAAASLPVAGFGGLALTGAVTRLLAKWMPGTETYAVGKAELIGLTGTATLNIDRGFGTANVRDRGGDLFQVSCRVYAHGRELAKDSRVVLVDYDSAGDFFYVAPFEPGLGRQAASALQKPAAPVAARVEPATEPAGELAGEPAAGRAGVKPGPAAAEPPRAEAAE